MFIIIFGSLFVGFLQCLSPFIDKIPLTILTPIEYIILKIIIGFIPLLILIFLVFYFRMDKKKNYNKKIILFTLFGMGISGVAYFCYVSLIKKYSPGIILPIILSCIVTFSLIFEYLFFKKNIRKIDILCIIVISISIYILSSNYDKEVIEKSMIPWIEYLKK